MFLYELRFITVIAWNCSYHLWKIHIDVSYKKDIFNIAENADFKEPIFVPMLAML